MEERNIGFELKTLSNLMKRKMENEISLENNVTGNHTYILGFLEHEKDRDIFQKDIEKEFSIRRSTATGILNIMEKRGLIERIPCKEDARQKKIIMTEKGKKIQEESLNKIEKFENALKSCLTQEEIENFLNILDKIKDNIEKI